MRLAWSCGFAVGALVLGIGGGAGAGEIARPGPLQAEICFSEPVAAKILRIVEEKGTCEAEVQACAEFVEAQGAGFEECRAEETALQARTEELTAERDRAIAVAKDAQQAGKEGITAAKGSWWQRAKSALSWMGAGAALAVIGLLLL